MWIGRLLDDLPDDPRLGARLIAIGALLEVILMGLAPRIRSAPYDEGNALFVHVGYIRLAGYGILQEIAQPASLDVEALFRGDFSGAR